jgi:hypothetical protein
MIPVAFYIVVAAAQLDLGVLRRAGWLFDMGNSADRSWYEFYTYFGEPFFSLSIWNGLMCKRFWEGEDGASVVYSSYAIRIASSALSLSPRRDSYMKFQVIF